MLSELQPALFTPEQAKKMVAPDATTTKQVLAVAARAFHKKIDVLDRRMPSKNGSVVVTTLKGLAAMSEFEGMETDRLDGCAWPTTASGWTTSLTGRRVRASST